MTATISASFARSGDAKEAKSLLRSRGCRVALTHQKPASASSDARCPGSGRPLLTNTVMEPDSRVSILTVLVSDDNRAFVREVLRRCHGKIVHDPS